MRPLPENPPGRTSMQLPTLTSRASPRGLACNRALQALLLSFPPPLRPQNLTRPRLRSHLPGPSHTGVLAPKQEENSQAVGDIRGTLPPPGPCRPASLS